ncbi:hypothetical protein ANO11243_071390 [Dothideomycetidae sp. 11243]|nr:hypothetical protein ANO11243_071390 [fungal sp. No.11243]
MSSSQVHRITYFKIADAEAQEKLLAMYKNLQSGARKVSETHGDKRRLIKLTPAKQGEPYIISAEAGRIVQDPRNQGFNIAAKTTFASMDDFEFYDKQCPAHKSLRSYAASVNQGSMMVFFQSVV